MKKEKNLESLSDDEILQGFKDANARIVREYYYGYCRVAYCIYDKRYDLQHKPGMDFFSLAHEYYLYLCEHDFKPLEDRKPSMSLKTWMVNGFRFLLLDKLKEVVKEHRFESFEARQESRKMQFDVTDNQFEHDLYQTIEDIGNFYYGRDSKNSIILKMLYIEHLQGQGRSRPVGHIPFCRHPALPKDDARCGDSLFQEILRRIGIRKLSVVRRGRHICFKCSEDVDAENEFYAENDGRMHVLRGSGR